jgi:hypothetical protein
MKQEAAFGLETPDFEMRVDKRALAIVGEMDWMLKDRNGEKKTLDWDAFLSAVDLKNLERFPNFHSAYIVRFRELLDKAPELNLDIETLKAVEIEPSKVESFVRRPGKARRLSSLFLRAS